jgi:hypothetical protein
LAELAAPGTVDSASVPTLRFGQIQTCGAALFRWAIWHVCIAPGSLHVLLAAILLLFHSRARMSALQPDSCHTSNDLLHDLAAKQSRAETHRLLDTRNGWFLRVLAGQLIEQDHIEQRLMDLDAAVVAHETELAKAVHKEADTGTCSADHIR